MAQDQTVYNNQLTKPVDLTSNGCSYTWTNSTPSIGLPSTGTGNIPSFGAQNLTNAPITATITATPVPSTFYYAYVTNAKSNTVAVINTQTQQIIKTINVGNNPSHVATSIATRRIFVNNVVSNSVSVINGVDNTLIKTVAVGSKPLGIAVSNDGSTVYVANAMSNSVTVLDGINYNVIKTLSVGTYPLGVTLSPDGKRVYVSNTNSKTISVIDVATNTLLPDIQFNNPIGNGGPYNVVLTPDGKRMFVATQDGVFVLDVLNGFSTLSIIRTPLGCLDVSITPDGSKVYGTGNGVSAVVYAINTINYSYSTIGIGSSVEGLCVSPDGKQVYVSNYGADQVAIINTATNTVSARIASGGTGTSTFGNFFLPPNNCGVITFKITVNPSPKITTSAAVGSISSCQGVASVSPQVERFNVNAYNLTGNITVKAPDDFDVSLNIASGYGKTVSLVQSAGYLNQDVYVRAAAASQPGIRNGNITLTTEGVGNIGVNVNSNIAEAGVVYDITNRTFPYGTVTSPIFFEGVADSYAWINNTPAIGLAASGTGNIPAFTAVNNIGKPLTANIIVTPILNSSTCSGIPTTFNITVLPYSSQFVIPNTFTPNGDGVNDKWNIPGLDTYPKCTVSIYNRNGQQVFYSIGYTKEWDGTINGLKLPIGTYYYLIDLKNDKAPLSGAITMLN